MKIAAMLVNSLQANYNLSKPAKLLAEEIVLLSFKITFENVLIDTPKGMSPG